MLQAALAVLLLASACAGEILEDALGPGVLRPVDCKAVLLVDAGWCFK
jgi:hypothetical protein